MIRGIINLVFLSNVMWKKRLNVPRLKFSKQIYRIYNTVL